MNFSKTWIGAAVKVGGHLAVVGGESLRGTVVRADAISNPQAYWTICSTMGIRFGLGVGGGAGCVGIVVFNASVINDLHNLDIGGWGANAGLGWLKPTTVAPDIYPIFQAMSKGVKFCNDNNKANMVTNFINSLSSIEDAVKGKVTPYAFVFDIPYGGWSAELSVVKTLNYKLQVQDLVTWNERFL